MPKHRRLWDAYRFPSFPPLYTVGGSFGDAHARVVLLQRWGKMVCGACGQVHRTFYDRKVQQVRDLAYGGWRIYLDVKIRRVVCKGCGLVKQEWLAWLAETSCYIQRFAFAVGRRCRAAQGLLIQRPPTRVWNVVMMRGSWGKRRWRSGRSLRVTPNP